MENSFERCVQAELACAQAELQQADDAVQEMKQLWHKCKGERIAASKLKVLLLEFDCIS